VLAVGIAPLGIISIGIVPMAVVSIRAVAMGVINLSVVGMGALIAGVNVMGVWWTGVEEMGPYRLGPGTARVHQPHPHPGGENVSAYPSRQVALEKVRELGCEGVHRIGSYWML
jgi:hypothetical protein